MKTNFFKSQSLKLIVSLIILLIGYSLPASAINITVKKLDNGMIQVKPEKFYVGNDKAMATFSFYFDEAGALCNMVVAADSGRMRYTKPIGVTFHMADGSRLIFGDVVSNDFTIFRLNFLHCVPSDFKGNYAGASLAQRNCSGLNKLSQVNLKRIEINMTCIIDVDLPTASVFKEAITKGIAQLSNKSNYSLFGKSQASASKASKSKSKTKSSGKSSNKNATKPKVTKPATDEVLRGFLLYPMGVVKQLADYFSYKNASEILRNKYPDNFSAKYEEIGKIQLSRLKGMKIAGYPVETFFLYIHNDKAQWSYVFNHASTLSEATSLCNAVAAKIKDLGIDLKFESNDSFAIIYNGKIGDKSINLSASFNKVLSNEYYYISLKVTDYKIVDKSELNRKLSADELFERPLGAPSGVDPIKWYVQKGYTGIVNEKQTAAKRDNPPGFMNDLVIEIPVMGSRIYKGLSSVDYSLETNENGVYTYTVDFKGDHQPDIFYEDYKKNDKNEIKTVLNYILLGRRKLGYNPIKTKKIAPQFKKYKGYKTEEYYVEQDGDITRTYFIYKENKIFKRYRIVVSEQKPAK